VRYCGGVWVKVALSASCSFSGVNDKGRSPVRERPYVSCGLDTVYMSGSAFQLGGNGYCLYVRVSGLFPALCEQVNHYVTAAHFVTNSKSGDATVTVAHSRYPSQ
jgi:hypothetical protein